MNVSQILWQSNIKWTHLHWFFWLTNWTTITIRWDNKIPWARENAHSTVPNWLTWPPIASHRLKWRSCWRNRFPSFPGTTVHYRQNQNPLRSYLMEEKRSVHDCRRHSRPRGRSKTVGRSDSDCTAAHTQLESDIGKYQTNYLATEAAMWLIRDCYPMMIPWSHIEWHFHQRARRGWPPISAPFKYCEVAFEQKSDLKSHHWAYSGPVGCSMRSLATSNCSPTES